MTFTEADLAPLKAAYLSGTTSVQIGERTVSFRSLSEIEKIIARVEAAIEAEAHPEKPVANTTNIRGSFSKYPSKE